MCNYFLTQDVCLFISNVHIAFTAPSCGEFGQYTYTEGDSNGSHDDPLVVRHLRVVIPAARVVVEMHHDAPGHCEDPGQA